MIRFHKTTIEECGPAFDAYLATISGINDDFWEEHILNCQLYIMEIDGRNIGLSGIHQNENLTLFYVPLPHQRYARQAFSGVLETLKPLYAFVPTNDELFLSFCMDNHTVVDKQAYFFRHSGVAVRAAEYGRDLLKPAIPADAADILDSEGVEENIRLGKYYVMRKNGVFLGQGFFNPHTIIPNAASIGMSVHPDHRQKGVGRSIILHLTDICREKGITPYCGCWYYNHNSKLTLESAGFVTRTRLLKVWFVDKPEEENNHADS